MAKEKNNPADERYRYIGFEVYGKADKEFWKNGGERKSYISHVREELGSVFRSSVVYSNILPPIDRIIITFVSLLMIVAPFLTWATATTRYGVVKFSGLTGIMHTEGFWYYVDLIDGWVIPATVYAMTALAYLSLIFGVITIVVLYIGGKAQATYLKRLKAAMRFQIIPFLIFLAIVLFGLIGQRIPFGQHLGIENLGGRYSIVTFVSLTSIGFWLATFGFIVNFNKSKEL